MKRLENISTILDEVQELANVSRRDLQNTSVRGLVCRMMADRLRSILFDLDKTVKQADDMREAGIRKGGFHYYDQDCDSGIRWFVIIHLNRTDDELVNAISNATGEIMYAYSPHSPYDCTGKALGTDARIKRGRKVAVVTQWRGLDT